MNSLFPAIDASLAVLQKVLLGAAIAVGGLCAVDWGVRTRRLSPFSKAARWTRQIMSPVIKPVERSVVRAGGNPATAPWWTLAAVVIGGILLLSILDFARDQIGAVYLAVNAGTRGILRLIVGWLFALMYVAIAVRVITSWFQLNPRRALIRWSYAVSEPILRPIRAILPSVGALDLSPLVAYILLSWFLEPLVMRLL